MKVMTVLGTRPEIIRLSRVIARLDGLVEHVLVHTGQNYDASLNDVFFRELGVRAPDVALGARGELGAQLGTILAETDRLLGEHRPDRLLVLGDTNSGLAAVVAKRRGVPVFHMEAGNRCYDDRVPEEVNRRVIDHCSDVLMPYTERSRQNLLREGIAGQRVFVTGNPILEVIRHYEAETEKSEVLRRLELRPGKYFLVTAHRAENVDVEGRLRSLTAALDRLAGEYGLPVIVSTHPRTRSRMQALGLRGTGGRVRFLEPFGFFDFITLERRALCVLSDSGTCQEECTLFGVPAVTLRDVTERPETLERGTNILSGMQPDIIVACVKKVLSRAWPGSPPPEYLVENVSETVVNLVVGYTHFPALG
jgi:UDP-N-acetylglucosamine 2-epimerase (non-hydrolysing)